MNENNEIPVEIIALVEEQTSMNPIVVLRDFKTEKVLPIWIGDAEARAIAVELNDMDTPRPLTHELVLSSIKGMGGTISRIVIDRVEGHTYYATIHVLVEGKEIKIDARPSDSIAVALAAKAEIFVRADVMEKAGQDNPFPMQGRGGPRKIELSKEDIDRIANLLQRAREREQKGS